MYVMNQQTNQIDCFILKLIIDFSYLEARTTLDMCDWDEIEEKIFEISWPCLNFIDDLTI